MIAGGVLLIIAGVVTGELGHVHLDSVSFASVAAFVYLVLIGALVGYVAYIWLLHHVSVTAASTYAFVNPVVAVALGAIVLGEQVTLITLVAATLIVGAVVVLLIGQSRKVEPAVDIRGAGPRRRLRACSPVTGDNGSVDSETLIVDTPGGAAPPRPAHRRQGRALRRTDHRECDLLLRGAATHAVAARSQPGAAQRAARQHRLDGDRRRLREGREGSRSFWR